MISQHHNCGDPGADDDIQQRFHLVGLAVVRKVSCQHQNVGYVAYMIELIKQCAVTRRREMQVCSGRDSHIVSRLCACPTT
jgi:hypothetical protein